MARLLALMNSFDFHALGNCELYFNYILSTIFPKFSFSFSDDSPTHLQLSIHFIFNSSQLTIIILNYHFTLYSPISIIIDKYLTFHLALTSPFVKYQFQMKYLTDLISLSTFFTSSSSQNILELNI